MRDVLNVAAYRFVRLEECDELAKRLRVAAARLKGTILLAPEGINLFLAGAEEHIDAFWRVLTADARFDGMRAKRSWSETVPFKRLLVKVKPEIVTMRTDGVTPGAAARISPVALKALLDSGAPVVLLDTRNRFEVEIGTFRGATSLDLISFGEFPARARALPEAMKDATVVTFCTGGIRCEKAAPLLSSLGFRNVQQLDGGILAWFEECGGAHFEGACFVFDERIALDAALQPTTV